ncbi:transposase [Variovorax sp. OK605]|nr:transposase [Variovorax sp. OK605]
MNSGKFAWPKNIDGTLTMSRPQFNALIPGLPWQLVGEAGAITTM